MQGSRLRMASLFITGTDTNVGKTFVTSRLLEALRAAGEDAVPYKPVCSGGREDGERLQKACGGAVPLDQINPTWFKTPAAPLIAGRIEKQPVSWQRLLDGFELLETRHDRVLVEGAGGWKVPLTDSQTVADLAVALALPVIIVVHNRLGALNHTLLTLESVRAVGLRCAGVVLNHPKDERDPASISNAVLLREWIPDVAIMEVLHDETAFHFDEWRVMLG